MARILPIVEKNKASRWLRLANFIIDYILAILVLWMLMILWAVLKYLFCEEDILETVESYGEINGLLDRLITGFCYVSTMFFIEKFSGGRSLGKLITGTKVVKSDGSKLTTDDLLKRNFSRIVPFDSLSFLGRNGWHDSWSDTRVVKIKDYMHAQTFEKELDTIGAKEIA